MKRHTLLGGHKGFQGLSELGFAWRRFLRRRRARRVARETIYARKRREPVWPWALGTAVLVLIGASLGLIFHTPIAPPLEPNPPSTDALAEPPADTASDSIWDRASALDPSAPPSPFTWLKMRVADRNGEYCFDALTRASALTEPRSDQTKRSNCELRDTVELARLSSATMQPVLTRCAIALRLYMWERHDLRELAREIIGSELKSITHQGSYACRKIRNSRGTSSFWSQHATANAFDVSGFKFEDGTTITLARDWGKGAKGEFLKAARDAACKRFNTVLGPDYNRLHGDHFHFDQGRSRICR